MSVTNNDDFSGLEALGFEEGELEMFFAMNPSITPQQLIQKYMEIAAPYFNSVEEAVNADYTLPGTNKTKHDLAKEAMYYIKNSQSQNIAAAAAGGSPLLHLKMMKRFIKRVKKNLTNKKRRTNKRRRTNRKQRANKRRGTNRRR